MFSVVEFCGVFFISFSFKFQIVPGASFSPSLGGERPRFVLQDGNLSIWRKSQQPSELLIAIKSDADVDGQTGPHIYDAALALNKISQRLIQDLSFRGVPQHPRPFAAGALIDLGAICRAKKRRWLKPAASTA
jgi:hypothetical protein